MREDQPPMSLGSRELFWGLVRREEGGEPARDVQVKPVAPTAHLAQHRQPWYGEIGALLGVVNPGWDDLNRVRTKEREVEDLLPHLLHREGVVRIGLWAIRHLVLSKAVGGL